MRVEVNQQRCQGHGLCVMHSPEVFGFDEMGYAEVTRPEVPAALLDAARRAVDSCPERAISLTTDSTHGLRPRSQE